MNHIEPDALAKTLDHTLLKGEATVEDVRRVCDEAKQYGFAAVCVNPCYVSQAAKLLQGSGIHASTAVSFPYGLQTVRTKCFEASDAVSEGADEIDLVINISSIRTNDWDMIENEVTQVVKASEGAALKVIIESCLMTDQEKITASLICKNAGAAFVETSTGYSLTGARADDVQIIREAVGPDMGVKASGGIRTYQDAWKMIQAGASRIGTSTAVRIMQEAMNLQTKLY